MQRVDFLIIGQGLAGSLLAYTLIKRGQSVIVVDNNRYGSASSVAAGLINPITGHRLNLTEHFFDYISQAKKLYWQIERDLDCRIYSELQQSRLIKNASQAKHLEMRKQQAGYQRILSDIGDTDGWFGDIQKHPYGAINVSQTAIVDTKRLLHCMRVWLEQRESFFNAAIEHTEIQPTDYGFQYLAPDAIEARKIVFCEGYQAMYNPWLSKLPFNLAKGEVLTVKPKQPINRMLSWGKWLAPISRSGNLPHAKLGSNYSWGDTELSGLTNTPAEFAAELKQVASIDCELIEHEVGIRPTTTQRKPFVGPLSNLSNAYCLNGLGSKGCLIAPHYVGLLCEFILKGTPLPAEVTQWL